MTATLLGEALEIECETEESPFPCIEDRVRILAPGILRDILTEAPLSLIEGFKPLTGSPVINSSGMVELPLPDDFLRLVSVRMSDWKTSVTELLTTGSKDWSLQTSRWRGIRGNPERPVAFIDYNTSGKRVLKCFSSGNEATLSTGLYVAMPKFDSGGNMEVPDALKYDLATRLAEAIGK